MKALKYLFFTTLKNSIKEIVKKPGKMILYVIFIGILVMGVAMSSLDDTMHKLRNVNELHTIILVLFTSMFILIANSGLSSGSSGYSMADVNILFQTPISQKRVLNYGLVKQIGTSLFLGFFLLFQYAWMNNVYGVTIAGLIVIMIGYGLTVFCGQITARLIYSLFSSNTRAKRTIKWTMSAIVLVMLAYILIPAIDKTNPTLSVIVRQANSPAFNFLPVTGWLKSVVVGSMTNDYLLVICGLAATLVFIFVILFAISIANPDFYEDVLQATEVSYSAITAKKEGKIVDSVPANVKVGKTGIRRGRGASVFYYKHLLENKRSRFFILDATSIMLIAVCIAFSFFMPNSGILPIFAFCIYIQIFSSALGRWAKEIILPYVYLVPAGAFKKLVMICQEGVLKTIVESIILFIPISMILHLGITETIACIIARTTFGVLFIAGNILLERLIGSVSNKTIIIIIYIVFLIVLAAPGLVLGIVASQILTIFSATSVILIVASACNLGISLLIMFFCRGILDYAELNNK